MSHCRRFVDLPISRREMLARCAGGFGAVAFSSMMASAAELPTRRESNNPFAVRPPQYSARAKNVIFLYMDGGPSQVDTFDPKPRLTRDDGKPFGLEVDQRTLQFDNMGSTLGSPWKFAKHGESGIEVSELFPHVARHVDKLCVVRSMTSKFNEHTFANYFLHTGHGIQGRPSMGAWVTYGLGSFNDNLPGFVVLNGGLTPPGGLDNFGSGFLPATYQASVFNSRGAAVANIAPQEQSVRLQRNKLDLIRRLDQQSLERTGNLDQIESAIASQEMAARMQMAVPELLDLKDESQHTLSSYGLDAKFGNTQTFGRICLLARRLVERGVRFIELTCPGGNGDRWDQHRNLVDGHTKNCLTVDQPIAALLEDLDQRGLLDETLVVWGGEFGRTPFAQGRDGRDHNPYGFTMWLAGGGTKGGHVYGETDEFGYRAIRDRAEIHDLHATMLHLLGVDHEKLTFHFSGRDMRLTDVHGRVLHDLVA